MGCVDKAVYVMLRCATLRELSNNAQGLGREIYVCCDFSGVVPEYQCAVKREAKKAQKEKERPGSSSLGSPATEMMMMKEASPSETSSSSIPSGSATSTTGGHHHNNKVNSAIQQQQQQYQQVHVIEFFKIF